MKPDKLLTEPKPPIRLIERPECPKWLSEIGWQVYKLIQEPKNRDRFRQMLIKWDKKYGKDPEYELLPLEVKERKYSLREMYVVLAAIHDSCFPEADPIYPWQNLDVQETVGTKYFGIMGFAPGQLKPCDERTLEIFLDSVKKDLPIKIGPVGTEPDKKPAEKEQGIAPAKRRTIWTRVKGMPREIYGITIERITKAWLDKYG